MKLHYAGEKGRAVCERDGLTATTFAYRDVPFSDSAGVVKDILVSVCDKCGEVVGIPPQSTPAIKARRELATRSIEANLPAAYFDALNLACFRIDSTVREDFHKYLLIYYVHTLGKDEKKIRSLCRIKPSAAFAKATNAKRRRLSLKVTPSIYKEFDAMTEIAGVTRTHLIKCLVHKIDQDIIAPAKPHRLSELQALAATAFA